VYYSGLLNYYLMILQVDSMFKQLKVILTPFTQINNWTYLWDICFAHKDNTDFYKTILDKNIINLFTNDPSNNRDNTIKSKHAPIENKSAPITLSDHTHNFINAYDGNAQAETNSNNVRDII